MVIKPLRQALVSRWVMSFVKKQIPPISATEQAAINAGDVWWEGELFRGQPDWKSFQAFPLAQLTQEEQAFLDNQVETLCGLIDGWKARPSHGLQKEVWDYVLKERFFSMLIPKEYGGLAFSALAQSTIVSKIASKDISVAVTVMVPNSLGPSELLLNYGTDQQKKYYLPRLASSEEIPCFGLTAPEAGSDAGSMVDTGVVCQGEFEGKSVLGLKLHFHKRYITLAPVATLVGLAFKCFDPEGLLGTKKDLGITLALIPAHHPGIKIGQRNYPTGGCFPNGVVKGDNIFIPLDWVIGGKDQIGQGWHMLMECLAAGRGISLPAIATASCKLSMRSTSAYARVRKQFKMPIGQFEGVESVLARMGGFNYMIEAMRVVTASAIQNGLKPSVVSAIAKYHMTEMARQSINDAMDIHGGRAVMMGPSNYLLNAYETTPVAITVEGANILTRNLIIFGQGALRCHPFLLDEIKTAQEDDLDAFDTVLFKHLGYSMRNGLHAWIEGLTGGRFISAVPDGPFKSYYRQLTRMSTALAIVSDKTMMVLGGSLKRKENLSARLGDILSYLYIASCVLKYYESTTKVEHEEAFVEWCLGYCLYQMQQSWNRFFDNFPYRWMGFIFKKYIFPWGEAYHYPSDKLSHKLSQALINATPIRDKLTQNIYIHGFSSVETAMNQELSLLTPLQKIKSIKALTMKEKIDLGFEQKLITQEEYEDLIAYAKIYDQAIAVDDFDTPAFV